MLSTEDGLCTQWDKHTELGCVHQYMIKDLWNNIAKPDSLKLFQWKLNKISRRSITGTDCHQTSACIDSSLPAIPQTTIISTTSPLKRDAAPEEAALCRRMTHSLLQINGRQEATVCRVAGSTATEGLSTSGKSIRTGLNLYVCIIANHATE